MTPDPNQLTTPQHAVSFTDERPMDRVRFNRLMASMLGAAVASVAPAPSRPSRRRPRSVVALPPRLTPRREKYPGQSRSYLRFAHRPMTAAQIRDHNIAVAQRKAVAA